MACPGALPPCPAHCRLPEVGGFSLGALRRMALGWLALLPMAGACGPVPDAVPVAVITAVDDLGDTVRLGTPATRIVSLIPATTELLFAMGLGDLVVGRTTWCDFPAAARAVPDLGDGLQPNLEAVVSVRPDLVVLYNSTQNVAAAERLRAQGIPAVLLNTDRLADVPRLARLLARLGGRAEAGDSLASSYDRQLAASSRAPRSPPPVILVLAWDQPPIAIGAGSFLSELVSRAGAVNAFADLSAASVPVSLEAVAARDIDLVLVLGTAVPGYASRAEWQSVAAVRDHRFLFVPEGPFSRPGPRSPEAIRLLGAAIDAVPAS